MSEEKKSFVRSFYFPFLLLVIMWAVRIIESALELDLYKYGILPQTKEGLIGILTSVFIHGDFKHLLANSAPVFILSWAMFYFYRNIATLSFILIYIITGFWVWCFARHSYHIGASGLIYGMASFIFTSGILRKEMKLMALSLFIVFMYGGLVWGIFPMKELVSWEAHLMGLISGVLVAYFFKKSGPQRKKYFWETEQTEDNDDDIEKDENGVPFYLKDWDNVDNK